MIQCTVEISYRNDYLVSTEFKDVHYKKRYSLALHFAMLFYNMLLNLLYVLLQATSCVHAAKYKKQELCQPRIY